MDQHMVRVYVGSVFAMGMKMRKAASGLKEISVKLLQKATLKWERCPHVTRLGPVSRLTYFLTMRMLRNGKKSVQHFQ